MPRGRYIEIVKATVAQIHEVDSSRLVIVDGIVEAGLPWMAPLRELSSLNVAESLHFYFPDRLTQYKWGWYRNQDDFATPNWPTPNVLIGWLCGPAKKDYHAPLDIYMDFDGVFKLSIEVEVVSAAAKLVVFADGSVVGTFEFPCNASDHEGAVKHYGRVGGGWYECFKGATVTTNVPKGAKKLTIEVVDGDWLSFTKLVFESTHRNGSTAIVIPVSSTEFMRNPAFRLKETGEFLPEKGPAKFDKAFEWDALAPWRELSEQGVGVHVGEFGVDNQTPHDVTLAWMRDQVDVFRRSGVGWALWNLRGPWGVLNSQRRDVRYEQMGSHLLDKKMLEVLQNS